MKPILVHVHVYYPSLWPELKDCLRNIAPHPLELFVTFVERHVDIEADIRACYPGAHLDLVENRGYDIAPFLHVLNRVNLDDYSYVIKLHTKRDITFFHLEKGENCAWRDYLLAFIRTRERFEKHLAAFEANPKIGMQADYHTHVERDIYDDEAVALLQQWLADHGLPPRRFSFVGGSMFIARASLMKMLQSYALQPHEFPPTHDHKAQLSHVVERLLGYFICHQGCLLSDGLNFREAVLYQRYLRRQYIRRRIWRFFYQTKITRSGKRMIKVLRIPVYRGRPRPRHA